MAEVGQLQHLSETWGGTRGTYLVTLCSDMAGGHPELALIRGFMQPVLRGHTPPL